MWFYHEQRVKDTWDEMFPDGRHKGIEFYRPALDKVYEQLDDEERQYILDRLDEWNQDAADKDRQQL